MTGNELLQTLERLLEEDGLSQEVVNRLVLALALENRHLLEAQQRQTAVELAELRHLLSKQAQNVDRLATAVADTKTYLDRHPPLLYLLRYRTRATAAALVLLFALLSLWLLSDLREPLLRLLGLPLF